MRNKHNPQVLKAIALCFKPFLKPEEAMIYTNLAKSQFARRCADAGVYKNDSGYYLKEEIDRMLAGEKSARESNSQLALRFQRRKNST